MTEQRRYTHDEVKAILSRAADISAGANDGTSLEELEKIAGEVGLDVESVRRAAAEVRTSLSPATARSTSTAAPMSPGIFGGPYRLRGESVVDVTLHESLHEQLASTIMTTIGEPVVMTTIGRSLTFTTQFVATGRNLVVRVAPVGDKTRISVEERLGHLAGGIWGGVGGGVGGSLVPLATIGAAFAFGPVFAVGTFAVTLLGTFVGTRAIYQSQVARKNNELEEVVAALAHTLNEAQSRFVDDSDLARSRAQLLERASRPTTERIEMNETHDAGVTRRR